MGHPDLWLVGEKHIPFGNDKKFGGLLVKNNFVLCTLCVVCSLVGGALGGYGFLYFEHRKTAGVTLKAQKLELTDFAGKVRASFGVKQDKKVSLRMYAEVVLRRLS